VVNTNNLSQSKVKTIQEQLVAEISKNFPDAEAKKVDKDNFLDIHIPEINPKRGTHLFFNTGKNEIKIGFYCRDQEFNNDILSRSSKIEAYAQGLRIKDNPAFGTVSEGISAALDFLSELKLENKQTKTSKPKESNLKTLVSAFNDKLVNEGLDDQMMDELDALTIPSSLLLYEISQENLQKAFETEIVTNDDFDLTKFVELGDWNELIENIGTEEVTKNKEEYASETIYSNGCILLLYCEGEYIYSFMSPGEEVADEDEEVEEEAEESVSNSDEINWADYVMADDSDSSEINLGDFDLDNNELVAKATERIKEEKTLTGLIYINTALRELGFEIDNHNPFFFTSLVHVSDRELSGFLYVNMDGFYSNCIEESEIQMIFSWDSVKDIQIVEEDVASIKINLLSEEGILSINEPYSKNLLVLVGIYKNIWKKVVKKFAGKETISWNVVENELGITSVTFDTLEEYKYWITGDANGYEIIESSVTELRKDINRRQFSDDALVEIIAYHKTKTEFNEDYTVDINGQEVWLTIARTYDDSFWKTQVDKQDLLSLFKTIETLGFQEGLDTLFGWEFHSPGKGDNGFEISLKEGDIKRLPKDCIEDGEINPYFIFENYSSNIEDIDVTLRGETDRLDIIVNEEYFGSIWQGAYPSN
jgi:hypothetical protein